MSESNIGVPFTVLDDPVYMSESSALYNIIQ